MRSLPKSKHRSRRSNRNGSFGRLESLEPRLPLAASAVISEFMASNRTTLDDGDRESSDWIEIFNNGDETLNLQGWHLTDSANELAKWTFPETTLEPEQYLVVFASGKDKVDSKGNLHTNFRLSAQGEYLALVQPDGLSAASEFAPSYPEQLTDVSYGIRMDNSDLAIVSGDSEAQLLVPADDQLGLAWTEANFDAADWVTETSPGQALKAAAGFENDSGFAEHFQSDVGSLLQGVSSSVYLRVPFRVHDINSIDEMTMRVKFDDGYWMHLNGRLIEIQNSPLFPAFDLQADAARPNSEAVEFREFDVTRFVEFLDPGINVLAIQALNVAADDDDFLIVPELLINSLQIVDDTSGFFSTPTPRDANLAEFSLGPAIKNVQHTPTQPGLTDALIVTANVQSRTSPVDDPIANVTLNYRVMYGDEVAIAMVDDGSGADQVAGDSIYSAQIPAGMAQPGEMLRYYVTATDDEANAMREPRVFDTTGTDQSPEYFGTVVADLDLQSELPIFEWFTERVSRARSRGGARASVYYQGEFYDNVFVRQRGGATNASSQKFNFNEDQKFFVNDKLGRVAEFNMNAQGSDASFIRQSLAYESYTRIGNESSDSFLMRMEVNGSKDRVGVFIEQVDEDFLQRHGLDPNGALYKFVQRSNLDPVFSDTTTGIEKKNRLDEGKDDVQAVVDGLSTGSREDRANSVFDHFDIAQLLNYLAGRSVTMDADDVRKNFYGYRDTNGTGQWSIFPWDKDWTFGVTGDGGPDLAHPYFGDEEHRKPNANQWNRLYEAVFTDPILSEMYLRRLRTVMDQVLQPADTPLEDLYYENRVDEIFEPAADELPRAAASQVNAVKRFFPQRRETLYVDHSIDLIPRGEVSDIISEFSPVQYFVPTNDDLGTSWTDVQEPANIAEWSAGTTGLGFHERFSDQLRTEVNPGDSCDQCTSIFVRMPFELDDPSGITALTMRMKYDDGFAAYLNGVLVAQENLRDEPAYNVRSRSNANTAAVQFENFSLTPHVDLLRPGANMLAIHAVNSSPTSSDMLISPVLVNGIVGGADIAGIPHAQLDSPAITIGRVEHDPASGNQDEEFVEISNPNDTAVDISGWRLTGGIEHTFRHGTVIAAGRSMYVSPDVQSFLNRAAGPGGGQGLFVQGNYRGHLSNRGETVQLLTADGSVMASFTTPNEPSLVQSFLRISEVHYNPAGSSELTEFIELTNTSSTETLNLAGVTISGGPDTPLQLPAAAQLGPLQSAVLVRDSAAFATEYPNVTADRILGVFSGNLSNNGESIKLDDARGNTVMEFTYSDDQRWPQRADGAGASLELIDPTNVPLDQLDKPYHWRGSALLGGSPAAQGILAESVVINEVVSNFDAPQGPGDAIELHNPSDTAIDIGGWFLSDSSNNLFNFEIPAGTSIAAGGYLVFDEADFNPVGGDGFGLSSRSGDDAYLVRRDAQGVVFVDDVHFGASRSGESFGRFPNASGTLAPMSDVTLGAGNGSPRVGPVIFSEVHYHPATPSAELKELDATIDEGDLEFLEIHNPTDQAVDLSGWRVRGGVDFEFRERISLASGETLIVTSFNPDQLGNATRTDAFRQQYGLDDSSLIVGGYNGQLSNGGQRVQLQRLSEFGQDGLAGWVIEDEVTYDDLEPWPSAADGTGDSLHREMLDGYGNDASNWQAETPSPGRLVTLEPDLNRDGSVDDGDLNHLCAAIRALDAAFDVNDDGAVDQGDLAFYLRFGIRSTFGDANLDGVFDSSDLVEVFKRSEYQDGVVQNSVWADGDWNCDGEFDSSDLIAAFAAGDYRR